LTLYTLVTLPKNCWSRVLGSLSAVIQLYAGECTLRVDQIFVQYASYSSLSYTDINFFLVAQLVF